MKLDIDSYKEMLTNEYPDYSFDIQFYEPYKNESEIYNVVINEGEEPEHNFSMVVGYLNFSEEQQKENFKTVVLQKLEALKNRKEKEKKQEEKEKKK